MATNFKSWTPPKRTATAKFSAKTKKTSSKSSNSKPSKGAATLVKEDISTFSEKYTNGRATGRTYEVHSRYYDDNTQKMTVKWFDTKGNVILPTFIKEDKTIVQENA